MPLQTHETSTDAQGGEAPDAPIPASPLRDPHDGLDLERKSGVDQGGVKTKTECFIAETAKGCDMDTLFYEEAASPPGKYGARPTIGWVTAPAPFPTSVRGRDSQRDR